MPKIIDAVIFNIIFQINQWLLILKQKNCMLARRIALEEQHLQNHLLLPENEKIITNYTKENNAYVLEFNGPMNTQYELQKFSIKYLLGNHYPFKPPNLYWVDKS